MDWAGAERFNVRTVRTYEIALRWKPDRLDHQTDHDLSASWTVNMRVGKTTFVA